MYNSLPRILTVCLFVISAMAAYGDKNPKPDPEKWLLEAEAAYNQIESYTALFHKQQRIRGSLLVQENIFIKFKKEPYSLYMKWVTKPHKGSELLYVEGWNKGRVRAHKGGFLSFIVRNLDPSDPLLMKNDLRPASSTGVGFLLHTVADKMRRAKEAGILTFTDRGMENIYDKQTRILVIDIPKEHAKAYDGAQFVMNQDEASKVLLRIRAYDAQGMLIENYGYENLKLNLRLSDRDFDPDNPAYNF